MLDQLTEIPLHGRRVSSPSLDNDDGERRVASPAFVAGPENRLVAIAINRLIDAAGASVGTERLALSPRLLVLFGGSGMGKTHIAHGLVRHWQQHRGEDAACYITAVDFRREYAAAVHDQAIGQFRSRLRGVALLVIDDLHQLPADDHLMQELRYTLDACEEIGSTVVITSNRPASTLANLSVDVRSRLTGGLMLQLNSPGTSARLRIVRHACAALGQTIPTDVASRLAERTHGTANDLIGSIVELCVISADGAGVDQSRGLPSRRPQPSLTQILSVVAKYMRVPLKQLRSTSRKQSIVFARSIAIFLARELTTASYHDIGRTLGGRDHTTIMHNYHKIDAERQSQPSTQELLDDLRRIFNVGRN